MATSLRRILITGGAGFVGSNLAVGWKSAFPASEVIALDNLKRRGSEITVQRLRASGVTFIHGDVRAPEDLAAVGPVDLLIECSAEPSVHAGYGQSPKYLINTNLVGLLNCLEHLRDTGGAILFLSSSRVYPIAALRALPLVSDGSRLRLGDCGNSAGLSSRGISEQFSLAGARSLYGATKLAAEMLIEEYRAAYGIPAIVNRCGVIAGPWQMGKVDQGFVVLWVARHLFGGSLSYTGFGGEGLQVRDVLHVDDLLELVIRQVEDLGRLDGTVCNVGGGMAQSISLRELTALCAESTGQAISIGRSPETRTADIPWYVGDNTQVSGLTGWTPQRTVPHVVEDILVWLDSHRSELEPIMIG